MSHSEKLFFAHLNSFTHDVAKPRQELLLRILEIFKTKFSIYTSTPPLSARFPRKKSIPLKREMLEQNWYRKRNKEKMHRRRIKKCKNYIYNSMRSVV